MTKRKVLRSIRRKVRKTIPELPFYLRISLYYLIAVSILLLSVSIIEGTINFIWPTVNMGIVIILIAIYLGYRYYSDAKMIQRFHEQDLDALYSSLASAKDYKALHLIVTTDYLIFDDYGIRIIPIEEISLLYVHDVIPQTVRLNKMLVVRTLDNCMYTVAKHTDKSKELVLFVNDVIQNLYHTNEDILFGLNSANLFAYHKELRTYVKQQNR